MSSKNPMVIHIPAVVDVRVDTRKIPDGFVHESTLRLVAEELGDDWFNLSKEHACMDLAEVGAGCMLDDFDMFIDEEGNSPLINETATMLAFRKEVCITGDAFIATTPEHDEDANETYTAPSDVDLVTLAYNILCQLSDDFSVDLEAVEITFDRVTSSSKDYWEPDYEGDAERRATGHSHLD